MGRLRARLCSRNEHKARELAAALPDWTIELLDANAYPPETGKTFYENARAKAEFGRSVGPPDAWMLGEDSGIEVDELDGGPGIESARRGGADPVAWLLGELADEHEARTARYRCELVALSPEGAEFRGTGVLEGRIAAAARGSEGFGYDPIFVPMGQDWTVAELGNAWKRDNSHRARAARALDAAVRARR